MAKSRDRLSRPCKSLILKRLQAQINFNCLDLMKLIHSCILTGIYSITRYVERALQRTHGAHTV